MANSTSSTSARGRKGAALDAQRTSPGEGTSQRGKKPRKKGRWWKISLATILGIFALGTGVVVTAYYTTAIPAPGDFSQAEKTQVFYADGSLMGEFKEYDRESVPLASLPKYIGQAVVASEDRGFYQNPGIDLKGILRALWNNVRGKPTQGASTITQQYVERYYLGTTTSLPGKFREAILALKISNELTKDQILESYLNTIYFGRGAYGIQVAAKNYFGKTASQLTLSESAMIIGIIPAPSAWDPGTNRSRAEQRWNRVLDLMVQDGWITQQERATQVFPEVKPFTPSNSYNGPMGYVLSSVRSELAAKAGVSEAEIDTAGLKIHTTIDPKMQQAAVDAVNSLPKDRPANNRVGLLSLNPGTGAVVAMYGGSDYLKIARNAATQDRAQMGSTAKPFGLLAALENGGTLNDRYESYSGMRIPGYDFPVRNYDRRNRGIIDLVAATKDSVNTVYVQLNVKHGADKTKEAMVRAGIPENTPGLEAVPSNILGSASTTAWDMARAYGTIASGGVKREPYLVSHVLDRKGNTRYKVHVKEERVFKADVVADATYAMQSVVDGGTGREAATIRRPAAGKTGTSEHNRSAWFAGFTPQLVTVVDMYQVGPKGEEEPLTPFGGINPISGGTWPTKIWARYMKVAVEGMPIQDFKEPVRPPSVAPSPTPSAEPTTEAPTEAPTTAPPPPSPSPTPLPTPTPTPTPTPSPSPTPRPTVPVEPPSRPPSNR